ncbi:MAG: hypothetical protein HY758_01400 [Nitrospirae bacterium]|nr:hypothetical protein [Nitrospirota bacterium]
MELSSKHMQRQILVFSLGVLFLASGCETAPSDNVIRDLLARHLEARKYNVIKIEVGSIDQTPLSERKYMTPKGYIVDIPVIILEAAEPSAILMIKKGDQLTFENVRITVRKASGEPGGWAIGTITGIQLP